MSSPDSHDRRLAALHAPRRNRYFAGKLLDPAGLQMEQEYSRGADAQLSRLVLGAGVVCGLEVTAGGSGDERGIRVSPGLALDGWGRRIVVPCETDVVALPADAPRPATLLVRLRYHAHAADPVPVPVPADTDEEDGSQAGTWIEGYRVEIREGTAPADGGTEIALELIRAGQVADALAALARTACAAPVSDPGVTLATITASADGGLTVDAVGPRAVVPTNLVLLQLIAGLAARMEECCSTSTL
jgi:hypothetical protein